MAILTYECGKTFSTLFLSEPVAVARNIADYAEHAAFMSEMAANWNRRPRPLRRAKGICRHPRPRHGIKRMHLHRQGAILHRQTN